jgi:hypothetical protein
MKMIIIFRPFLSSGEPVEWNWRGKTEVLGEKPVPVPLCPPQIPHALTSGRTRASAVGGRRLTAWAMARLSPLVNWCNTRFKIHKVYVLPTQCIYVFCMDVKTNSDYFPMQHQVVFITRRSVYCAVRTVFKYIIHVKDLNISITLPCRTFASDNCATFTCFCLTISQTLWRRHIPDTKRTFHFSLQLLSETRFSPSY